MTYKKVQDEYHEQHGRTVKSCWIAHIKRDHNATTHRAYNRGPGKVKYPCPPEIYPKLEKIIKKHNMI